MPVSPPKAPLVRTRSGAEANSVLCGASALNERRGSCEGRYPRSPPLRTSVLTPPLSRPTSRINMRPHFTGREAPFRLIDAGSANSLVGTAQRCPRVRRGPADAAAAAVSRRAWASPRSRLCKAASAASISFRRSRAVAARMARSATSSFAVASLAKRLSSLPRVSSVPEAPSARRYSRSCSSDIRRAFWAAARAFLKATVRLPIMCPFY